MVTVNQIYDLHFLFKHLIYIPNQNINFVIIVCIKKLFNQGESLSLLMDKKAFMLVNHLKLYKLFKVIFFFFW